MARAEEGRAAEGKERDGMRLAKFITVQFLIVAGASAIGFGLCQSRPVVFGCGVACIVVAGALL